MKITRNEIIRMAQECGDWNGETAELNDVGLEHFFNIAFAAGAAHKSEKLTEQKPVAHVDPIYIIGEPFRQKSTMSWAINVPLPIGTKLYSEPVCVETAVLAERDSILEIVKTIGGKFAVECIAAITERSAK
jgi:hypothetical protein